MASIGLRGIWTGKYAENTSTKAITYTVGQKLAKAISANITWTKPKADLYADDGLDDSVSAITKGQLSFTPNDITEEEFYPLMGILKESITINGKSQEVYTFSSETEGSFVGLGYIARKRKSGEENVKVVILPKVKFNTPESEESQTKGENTTFSTPAITADIYKDVAGNFKYEEVFDTDEEAVTFLEEIFAITVTP